MRPITIPIGSQMFNESRRIGRTNILAERNFSGSALLDERFYAIEYDEIVEHFGMGRCKNWIKVLDKMILWTMKHSIGINRDIISATAPDRRYASRRPRKRADGLSVPAAWA